MSDIFGTKAYSLDPFLHPCLAQTVQCLCGGRSTRSGKCVIRKGCTFRRIVDTYRCYFLVGVKYECTRLQNAEEIERGRIATMQMAE
jgi:hypothetical protein